MSPRCATASNRPWLQWSWFGLSCLGWTCTPVALRAQNEAGPIAADDVRAVLHELDALFVRGDVGAYVARFVPDHPGAHAMLQRRLERLVAAAPERARTSSVVGEPRSIGPRTVVHVQHETVLRGGDGRPDARFTEHGVLALRTGGGAGAATCTPTFAVEIAPEHGMLRGDRMRCPPCNYEVGGVHGWLGVSLGSQRACATEAVSFYLIGTDVACDVSVRVEPETVPAATVAQGLFDALRELEPNARAGVAETWTPSSGDGPHGLTGARLAVDLPDCAGKGGARVLFHVATFGGMQHLLIARGSNASLRHHGDALTALLASYRLLETDGDAATAAARALAHHTGGKLADGVYYNGRYGIEQSGPDGWRAMQRTGGGAFCVVWTSPAGSRLWLTGHEVPPGMQHWCKATAERYVQSLLARLRLTADTKASGSKPWHQCSECKAPVCLVVATANDATAPPQRWIRVALDEDLLVIADGFAVNAADEQALHKALAALRRH